MINNLITHLKEEASEDAEHKIWCDTELTTNARPQLKIWMENLAMEVAELSAQVSRLREEVSNANLIRHEETATNEEAIKDVQDAQSNLTQAIPIVMDFFAKAGQGRLSYAFRSLGHRRTYNRNQVGGTNIFGSLQVIQTAAPRDSSRKPQPTRPKWYAFLTTSPRKWWKYHGQ